MVLYAGISGKEREEMAKIKVLEVDQWTYARMQKLQKRFSFSDFDINKVTGGDADAVKQLGIVQAAVMEVDEHAEPSWGKVWLKEGSDGKLEKWKDKIDSS
jgi:hypothetical protein